MTFTYEPELSAPPYRETLAAYLSITGTLSDEVRAALGAACDAAIAYEMGRLSPALLSAAGVSDPLDGVPAPVAQAMLMRAAAIYRRANSVGGFEGYDDLGTVPVRASDPDIERLVDPYRAWPVV